MTEIIVNILYVGIIIAVIVITAIAYIVAVIKRQSENRQKQLTQAYEQMSKWAAESEQQAYDSRSLEVIPATEYDTKTVFQPVQPTIHKSAHKHTSEEINAENEAQKGSDNTPQSHANELFEETDIRKAIIMAEILAPKFDKE